MAALQVLRATSVGLILAAVVCAQKPVSVADLELTTTTRVFNVGALDGQTFYQGSTDFTTDQCPTTNIVHQRHAMCSKTKDVVIVPHSTIIMDGMRCGTGKPTEYMTIVSGSKLTDARSAEAAGVLPIYKLVSSNVRALNAMTNLANNDPVYVGVELTADRLCGGVERFPQSTIYIFIGDIGTDINFTTAYLGGNELGFIALKPTEEYCIYKSSRNLGPGQAPWPTPTPSPKGIKIPDDSVFKSLVNPADLPCFPLIGMTDGTVTTAPTPSNTPKPKNSVTVPSPPSGPPSKSPKPSVSTLLSPITSKEPQPSVSITPSGDKVPVKPNPSISGPATIGTGKASPTPSKSPTPSNTSESDSAAESGDSACFPSAARVELSTGATVPISKLEVGDRVRVSSGAFSDVFMFTHRTPKPLTTFVRLTTLSNETLALSPNHYLPVGTTLRTASTIALGELLTLSSGETSPVTQIEHVLMRGLYNPQTLTGDIVVDNVVASTLTRAVAPTAATALLAPLKALYTLGVFPASLGRTFDSGSFGLAALVPTGSHAF